jgi:hypothetical protein
MTPTECRSDCVLLDDELIRWLTFDSSTNGSNIAMARWLESLGRFGRLVLPTFCLGTFNKFV